MIVQAEAEKAARERAVFQNFIKICRLPIAPESVESCKPPKPDILCVHDNDGPVAFELVEICDQSLAYGIATTEKNKNRFLRGGGPWRDALRKKFKTRYSTEYPIELLCYTDARTLIPDDRILAEICPLLEMNNGQFRRVWLRGDQCHVLWPVACDS